MLNILYCNTNRSKDAHAIMEKHAEEMKVDIICTSEPNWSTAKTQDWVKDEYLESAIHPREARITRSGAGFGFCYVELHDIIIYSCYISPNSSHIQFEGFLKGLESNIRSQKKPIILVGDFNAKSQSWGSTTEDKRGSMTLDWAASLDLVLINEGNVPTFRRGEQQSHLDLTFASSDIAGRITNWKVLDDLESLSDHNNIIMTVTITTSGKELVRTRKYRRPLPTDIARIQRASSLASLQVQDPKELTDIADSICTKVLNVSRKYKKAPVYWWNENIANLRAATINAKRHRTRVNKSYSATIQCKEEAHTVYCKARRDLRSAIRESKEAAYLKLLEDLKNDPWGKAYKMFTKKKPMSYTLMEEDAEKIAQDLFPTHPSVSWVKQHCKDPPLFTIEELNAANEKTKTGKAPGPDGIPPEVTKAIISEHPEECLEIYNRCLIQQSFPACWKVAELLLLPKGSTGRFRPICLLDCFGKVLERLLSSRIEAEISLSDRQFGFRKNKSTTDAINMVLDIAKRTKAQGDLAALICIDVKNAFNSAPWKDIVKSLELKNAPEYLLNMVKSYLEDRFLKVGSKTINITAGVPQGSVLGPLLWNALYDSILTPKIPNTEFVCFADDFGILVRGKDTKALQSCANHAVKKVIERLQNIRLELAAEKTDVVLLVGPRGKEEITINVEGTRITSKRSVKYLGVLLSRNMHMGPQVERAAAKGTACAMSLARVLPARKGTCQRSRKTIVVASLSAVLYAAPVWAEAMERKKYRDLLRRKCRSLIIRSCFGCTRMATVAAEVLAGIPPLHLQVQERAALATGASKEVARRAMLERWQEEWSQSTVAQWTRRLIPAIGPWMRRRHGWLSYGLTQLLGGHGSCKAGLHKAGLSASPECDFCGEIDDTNHAFFECKRFLPERRALQAMYGPLTADRVVGMMLGNPSAWDAVRSYTDDVVGAKENIRM